MFKFFITINIRFYSNKNKYTLLKHLKHLALCAEIKGSGSLKHAGILG